eukprot:8365960-Lingulodinium_polyedra.AAC.1
MASEVPLTMPPSSASPEERATTFWVEDQCFSRCPPRRTHPPLVERRANRQPAKSVSVKAWATIRCSSWVQG